MVLAPAESEIPSLCIFTISENGGADRGGATAGERGSMKASPFLR